MPSTASAAIWSFTHWWASGWADSSRSVAQLRANPSLRMPPGASVERTVSAMTDSGVMARRCGGRVWATNSWLIPM